MSRKKIVVVSHSMDEAITKCVLNHQVRLDENIVIISLQALLSDYEIFDEVSQAGTCIRWTAKTGILVSNADHALLNRVLYVPADLFDRFKKSDREYAQRELEAYIGFSFNAFDGTGNHLANGVCVDNLSLPQQWERVSKSIAMRVPDYYWGPLERHCRGTKDILVYSEIYNFLNWSRRSALPDKNHIFCFEKPKGQPVFVLSIGKSRLLTSDAVLADEVKGRIIFMAEKINKLFNYFIHEVLFFYDGKNLSFGCINPDIVRSVKNRNFNHFVCQNLVREFYQCMR